MGARRSMWEHLRTMGAAAAIVLLVRALVIEPFNIPSGSMRPALEPGDSILVNRLVYHLHGPSRGDIIVFRYPQDESQDFVKRVIGLPGDLVEERDGQFWVNGAPAAEPHVLHSGATVAPPVSRRVPARQLFVLGDNRDASLDSRYWGTVDERNVIGKVFMVYWSRGQHWWDVRWDRIGRWVP